MRQIVIDTETTGLHPDKGHKIIEIGCVELIDRQLTGNKFHKYINPEREVEEEALAIHGITNEFLQDKPLFIEILDELLEFINGSELIAHNANFDVGFINYEIQKTAKEKGALDKYVTVLDTLAIARKKFPGQRNTLDAICKRYQVDLSERKLHGALLDAELLAEAYLLMTGGQGSLFSEQDLASNNTNEDVSSPETRTNKTPTIVTFANSEELKAHSELLKTIKEKSDKCQWHTNEEDNEN